MTARGVCLKCGSSYSECEGHDVEKEEPKPEPVKVSKPATPKKGEAQSSRARGEKLPTRWTKRGKK